MAAESKIDMVDLRSQYLRLKPEIDAAMMRVVDSAAFIRGPDVDAFELELAAYTGSPHVVTCANGTDALQVALMALGLKPGDEVITPDFTYFATAEVIALLGLRPVLVDVEPDTFCIDVAQCERAITSRTRAIVPVHLFGQCADMEPLLAIAKRHGVFVVEDNAQAIGAVYTFSNGTRMQAGTMGDIGTTSFFPSKNLGCFGDGGALLVRDADVAARVRTIANHGQTKKYVHDVVGVNSRLDTIQAAILRVKLKHLDDFAARRHALAAAYDAALEGLGGIARPTRRPSSTHVFHQYTVRVGEGRRAELASRLSATGIPTQVYYPIPLHDQRAFDGMVSNGSWPVSTMLANGVLSLPMHTEFSAPEALGLADRIRSLAQGLGT